MAQKQGWGLSVLKHTKLIFIGGAAIALLAVFIVVKIASSEERINALPSGVAMDGFDVVAYFSDGAPTQGGPAHSVSYKGKSWRFSTAENDSKFSEMPAKYAPQFNGFCAYAASEGYSAEVDFIDGWIIIEDKLYLNWNENTKDVFIEEQEIRLPNATRNWPVVHAGLKTDTVPFYTHAAEGVDIKHPQQVE